jgi:hypothetical protein
MTAFEPVLSAKRQKLPGLVEAVAISSRKIKSLASAGAGFGHATMTPGRPPAAIDYLVFGERIDSNL